MRARTWVLLGLLASGCGGRSAPDSGIGADAAPPDGGATPVDAGAASLDGGASTADAGALPDDYLLFAPIGSTTTYLIDRDGQVVHSWSSDARPGLAVYLLDDGTLLRTENLGSSVFGRGGGAGGRLTAYDWDANVLWHYDYSDSTHCSHHDVAPMPNGHVLMIAWEVIASADAIAAGRDPSTLPSAGDVWADHVIEVDPASAGIVWEWHLFDHLVQDRSSSQAGFGVVADHPELVDVNYAARAANDWTHVNAIDYDADLDQIVLSVHNFDELWIVDHGTTTAEAASHEGGPRGHGGDLLYRWGNPASYGAGTAADQQLFSQHDVAWIAQGLPGAGDLLMFDNGNATTRAYSSVDELTPPLTDAGTYGTGIGGFAPGALTWSYTADPPESMFAARISGAQRLPSGNTLICIGPEGRFIEVTADGRTVWTYTYPSAMASTFRVTSYPASYSAFAGRDLTPEGPIRG